MKQETPEEPTRKKRLSRYKADRTAFPDFEPNSRDKDILKLVYSHRFLDTELLWHLMQPDETETVEKKVGADGKLRPSRQGFGMQALYRRLQLLSHPGFLQRHQLSDQPIGRGYGTPRTVFGVGQKSCVPLARMLGTTPENIRKVVEANQVKSPFLRHALETARFRVLLELACRKSAGRVRLLFWEQGLQLRDWVTGKNEYGDDERFSVCPDAFFALEVEDKGRANYFLEIDRGTEVIKSAKNRLTIQQKLLSYRAYRTSEKFQTRYAYRTLPSGQIVGIDRCEESPDDGRLMVTGFQVLFVVPGQIHPNGQVKGRVANILSRMPSFGKFFATTSLFWFTTPDSFSLNAPLSVFDAIWLTVKPTLPAQSLVE